MCVGTPWATPAQEAMDERNDAEIFRAVVSSMEQWQKRHNTSHHRRKRAESQVCYDNLGCFQDSGPYGYLDMLPSTPEDVGTRFLLYASHTTSEPAHDVPFANITQVWSWAESSFNKSAPTKVIVHGFGSDCDHVWVYEMKSALMAVEPCNVICVDWGHGAAVPNYVKASANTRLVGKQVALLLGGLQTRGLNLKTTHVIGFSLGAHVAGFAGAQLKNLSRITGLDPAGPLFESQDPRARLDSSDAMFVDVIHSNGENLILGGLGSWQPMGHVDFYPNGGRMQKGCSNLFVGAVTDILWSATEVEGRSLCNHRRAYKFFTDSLSPRCHFPAFPCESYDKFLEGACFPCAGDKRCGNMGYYADKSTVRGTLFLITRDEEPFCAHQYHVRVESAPSDPPAVSYGKMQITLVGSADINETFTLTQKDDAEIRVGVPLTRIAVPHPALQEPRSVQLTYTAYSGWLSSGLSKWIIDKLTLTDSFGKSLSVCKKGLTLDSGKPVTLPLYPGECNPPRTAANTTVAAVADTSNKTSSTFSSLLDIFRYKPTPVVQIGDEDFVDKAPIIPPTSPEFNPKVTTSSSDPLANKPNISILSAGPGSHQTPVASLLDIAETMASELVEVKPWQPVEYNLASNTNSLVEKDIHEDSRAFNDDKVESFSVANRSEMSEVGRNVSVMDLGVTFTVGNRSEVYAMVGEVTTKRPEIKEPVLLATTSKTSLVEDKNSTFRPRAISLDRLSEELTTSRPEIKEPLLDPTARKLKPIHTRHVVSGEWTPRQDLKPPAMDASWRYWDRHDGASSGSTFEEWQRGGNVAREKETSSVAVTRETFASPRIDVVAAKPLNETTAKEASRRTGKQMTVQLFPQRLAAFLSQAERFARQQLLPYMKVGQNLSSHVQKIAANSRRFSGKDDSAAQRQAKHYGNANPGNGPQKIAFGSNRNESRNPNKENVEIKSVQLEKSTKQSDTFTASELDESAANPAVSSGKSGNNAAAQTMVLVPYSYHTNNRNQKYIPLQFTDDTEDRGTEHE